MKVPGVNQTWVNMKWDMTTKKLLELDLCSCD